MARSLVLMFTLMPMLMSHTSLHPLVLSFVLGYLMLMSLVKTRLKFKKLDSNGCCTVYELIRVLCYCDVKQVIIAQEDTLHTTIGYG